MSRLVIPRPPAFDDVEAVRTRLRKYLLTLANVVEVSDRGNLKRDDRIERTRRQVNTVSTTYTIGPGDDIVLGDTDGGAFTVTLPPAADDLKEIRIKNIGSSANDLTVDGNGSETIDGATTKALTDAQSILIVSDGTEWWILADA